MGFLTEVVIKNDALGAFEKDPKLFGETILKGINEANMKNQQVSMGFNGYANYISVEPSRHADHEVLFIHSGNHVSVIGNYEQDWEALKKRNVDYAISLLKKAKDIIKRVEKNLKNNP